MTTFDAHMTAVTTALGPVAPVGRGIAPDSVGWSGAPGQSAFVPYLIVWRTGAKDIRHRDLDGAWDEARQTFHVRAIGGSAQQADELLDAALTVVLGDPITIAGRTVVHLMYETSFSATRDDDVQPPVFYAGVSFQLWTQET